MTKYFFLFLSFLLITASYGNNKVQETLAASPLPCRQYVINGELEGDYKLLIFLHGMGQRGNDNTAQITMGKDQLIEYCLANDVKVVAIFPQCPETDMWMRIQWQENALPKVKPTPSLLEVLNITEAKAKEFNAAETYITGFSMGGFGSWLAVGCRPDLFDAAAPLCGGGDLEAIENLAAVPMLVVHGTIDDIVPVFSSRIMVNAIWNAGGQKVIYQELPEVNHDCWTVTYNSPATWKWLFAQKKDKVTMPQTWGSLSAVPTTSTGNKK